MCKKMLVLLLVVCFVGSASATLLQGYSFPEAQGEMATTADSGSNGVTGVLAGGANLVNDDGSLAAASWGAAGGRVLALDGVDDYVEIGSGGTFYGCRQRRYFRPTG